MRGGDGEAGGALPAARLPFLGRPSLRVVVRASESS